MSFLADQINADETIVSDGQARFTVCALRSSLPSWQSWLQSQGISRHECIALPVRSDARSAAAVLALLELGQSVLLWRQSLVAEGGRIAPGVLPAFCRSALLDAEPPAEPSPAAVTDPESRRLAFCENRGADERPGPLVYVTTSGTTGKSKIAAFTHDSLRGNARNCLLRLGVNGADRVIVPVPLAHMYGLGAAFLPAMLAGASVRLVPEANLLRYLEAESEFDPNVAYLTPGFAHLLLKGRKQPRPYRLTVLAGDRAGEATFIDYERRHGCTVNLYGSTELGVIAAGNPRDSFEARRDCAGVPLENVELAPPETETVSPGQAYPLRVRHPYGTSGYADDSGRPTIPEVLASDGWYHTQDLGWIDEAGRVRLVGRQDHCVKRDGMLVAFADVEKALLRIPGIEHAVVIGGGLTVRGKELVAFCAGGPTLVRDTTALARSARAQLASHAVPDRFVILDELPLTDTGKPDRLRLATLSAGQSGS